MNVLLSGGSGFVGRALTRHLISRGHHVSHLVRRPPASETEFFWSPDEGRLETGPLAGMDAVIHLGGENIAGGRWTRRRKERIRSSRIDSTSLLGQTLTGMSRPPSVFLCASATGIYGDRGEELLTEESPPGKGFLADVCVDWEAAARCAAGVTRVVNLRFGMILDSGGGALQKMSPIFRCGLGGRLGSGRQFWNWITLHDAVRAVEHLLETGCLHGPVNLTAPESLPNAGFTRILAASLHRPAFLPAPAFLARLALGEMADATLLASARVKPGRLLSSGFRFDHPDLPAALNHALRTRG